MIQFNPCLRVERVIIARNQNIVYDEHFHPGVNIIHGANSSGKSTILNFIFYGLGGDLTDWSDIALSCTHVLIEAYFNGFVATLRREVSDKSGRPMDIYGGSYNSSLSAPIGEWIRYPYRRSENLESFSQALFRLLNIPEVTSDETGNLTIHQILRLLYADQLSPVEQIFKFEPFDSPQLRDNVGRLLCGAYESEMYNNEVQLKELTRAFDQANAELKSLLLVLGKTGQAQTLDWIDGQKLVLKENQAELQAKIEHAERRLYQSESSDELTLTAQNQVYSEVQRLQNEILQVRRERDRLALNIADSNSFIETLDRKLYALTDAETVAKQLGDIRFHTCPACYAQVDQADDHLRCHLCKSPVFEGAAQTRIVTLINETGRQLKQSRILQKNRVASLERIEEKLLELDMSWERASQNLTELQQLPSNELRAELRRLNRDAGYLERQIEDLDRSSEIAVEIQEIVNRKEELNRDINSINNRNSLLRASQSRQLQYAHKFIQEEVSILLRSDLKRQDAFVDAHNIDFDFFKNTLGVDGQVYFSASSRVVLRSSFFVGFLFAATDDREFRHPRFCMLDTIEDKGMEQVRSHNFQRVIVERSEKSTVEHQIIFATAMINPSLDNSKYTVGRKSTMTAPTINTESVTPVQELF